METPNMCTMTFYFYSTLALAHVPAPHRLAYIALLTNNQKALWKSARQVTRNIAENRYPMLISRRQTNKPESRLQHNRPDAGNT